MELKNGSYLNVVGLGITDFPSDVPMDFHATSFDPQKMYLVGVTAVRKDSTVSCMHSLLEELASKCWDIMRRIVPVDFRSSVHELCEFNEEEVTVSVQFKPLI